VIGLDQAESPKEPEKKSWWQSVLDDGLAHTVEHFAGQISGMWGVSKKPQPEALLDEEHKNPVVAVVVPTKAGRDLIVETIASAKKRNLTDSKFQ
jgi:hypothetical protein